jgi:hypothetical protein
MLSSGDGWTVGRWRPEITVLRYQAGLAHTPLVLWGMVLR